MKILFLCHRLPYPPNKGDKIRSFNILRHLAEKHELYVACLADDKRDMKYKPDLLKFAKAAEVAYISKFRAYLKMFWRLITGKPLTLGYFFSRRLQKTINVWLNRVEFDAIYVFSSGVAQYALNKDKICKIMDFVDMDSDKWLQNAKQARFPVSLIYRIEGLRMQRYEARLADYFQHSIVITENEHKLFKAVTAGKQALVIPNGIDYNYFSNNGVPKVAGEPIIIFTGAMDYFANVDGVLYFYNEIFPSIKTQIKDVKFYIVGNNPSRAVRRLSRDKNIIVTGFAEDIRPYLQKAAVYVVPLRIARGIQNKILEAMSMELSVVTTSQAAKNLNVRPGEDIFVEDTPQGFAQRVIELLSNGGLRQRTGANARETIKKHYNWQENLQKIEDILKV